MDEIRRKKYDRSGNKITQLDKARMLRREMTSQERKLWYCFLRDHRLHWYKQYVFESYILDFYCSSVRLAVEVDGLWHFNSDSAEYDDYRSYFLSCYGIEVIRFTNSEIDNSFGSVCKKIDQMIFKGQN